MTTFVVDGSLAMLCGLMLSCVWLNGASSENESERDDLPGSTEGNSRLFAGLLFVSACLQGLLLAIDFCGQTSLRLVVDSMPDVAATHTGRMDLALCIASFVLWVVCWMHWMKSREWMGGFLLAVCLVLRGSVGHAAVDGMFSWSELLQLIHLTAMAIWSGGVLVSGLLIVRRVSGGGTGNTAAAMRPYLGKLSAVSTYAVGFVLLTGIVKSYRATGGSLLAISASHWGNILLVKSAVVTLTVLLGTRNRWLLSSRSRWSSLTFQRILITLRAESMCMIAVLLLSAWLANTSPPLD